MRIRIGIMMVIVLTAIGMGRTGPAKAGTPYTAYTYWDADHPWYPPLPFCPDDVVTWSPDENGNVWYTRLYSANRGGWAMESESSDMDPPEGGPGTNNFYGFAFQGLQNRPCPLAGHPAEYHYPIIFGVDCAEGFKHDGWTNFWQRERLHVGDVVAVVWPTSCTNHLLWSPGALLIGYNAEPTNNATYTLLSYTPQWTNCNVMIYATPPLTTNQYHVKRQGTCTFRTSPTDPVYYPMGTNIFNYPSTLPPVVTVTNGQVISVVNNLQFPIVVGPGSWSNWLGNMLTNSGLLDTNGTVVVTEPGWETNGPVYKEIIMDPGGWVSWGAMGVPGECNLFSYWRPPSVYILTLPTPWTTYVWVDASTNIPAGPIVPGMTNSWTFTNASSDHPVHVDWLGPAADAGLLSWPAAQTNPPAAMFWSGRFHTNSP